MTIVPPTAVDRLAAKLDKLPTMSAPELKKFTDKIDGFSSIICRALINAGYGMERGLETRARAAMTGDALACLYVKVSDLLMAARDEYNARMRWQGNPRPIKRRA